MNIKYFTINQMIYEINLKKNKQIICQGKVRRGLIQINQNMELLVQGPNLLRKLSTNYKKCRILIATYCKRQAQKSKF